jgi:hypothetical protein
VPEVALLRETDGTQDADSELHDKLRARYDRAFEESSPEFKALFSSLDGGHKAAETYDLDNSPDEIENRGMIETLNCLNAEREAKDK